MSVAGRRLTARRVWHGARRRAAAGAHGLLRTNGGITWHVIDQQRMALRRRRSFGPADLTALHGLISSARAVLTLRDVAATPQTARAGIIALRHDMDHDVENSVRFATWEASRRIRSTYLVLHTDWYWGADPDRPSRFLTRALHRIAALGHEIGVHNNSITAALRSGGEPIDHLARAVNALRRQGFEITGTVAHGDEICHVAHFVNSEVFLECPDGAFGPADRVIRWDDPATGRTAEVTLRPAPMSDLGLSYEARYLGPLLYLSDTGGRWSVPFGPMAERFAQGDALMQVLTHPVWWAFQGEPVAPKPTIRTPADIHVGGRQPLART